MAALVALLAGATSSMASGAEVFLAAVDGGLPFSAADLESAARLRLSVAARPAPDAVTVTARALRPGWVRLEGNGRARDVWLGERTGPEAARAAALILVDLAHARRPAAPPDREPAIAVALSASAAMMTVDGPPRLQPGLELRWGLTRAANLAVVGAIAYARSSRDDPASTVDRVALRLGLGIGRGAFSLAGGFAGGWYAAAGAQRSTGVVAGAALWVSAQAPVAWPIAPYLCAGVDVLGPPLQVRLEGRPAITTRLMTPFAGLGLAWRGRR